MKSTKVRSMMEGAMLAALFGVLGIINLYTGSLLDIVFSYIMTIMLAWYTYRCGKRDGLCTVFVSAIILFVVGEMFFMIFSTLTMFLGVYFGIAYKNDYPKQKTKHILLLIAAIKDIIIYFALGSLLGISVFKEGMEMYQELINFIPVINIIPWQIMFILMWVFIFWSEYSIIYNYGNIFFNMMKKRGINNK